MRTFRNVYFSAGEYCATAHQIRRATGHREAQSYFFDWIVTRGQSFAALKRTEPEPALLAVTWDVIDDGLRVLDTSSGLSFQHHFAVDSTHRIDRSLVSAGWPEVKKQFEYLREKTRGALASATRGVLVRSESDVVDRVSAERRLAQLRDTFWSINPGLRFVLASTRLDEEVIGGDALFLRLAEPSPADGPQAWQGDDTSWDRVFALAEQHLFSPASPA